MAVKKLYYSMGEVAEMFDVNRSLIRHWESKFDCLRPHKNQKGNRMFTPADVEKLKQIYHLVKEQGMTLEGARKAMKGTSRGIPRDTELLERLQRIRSTLVEVREELKMGDDDQVVESTSPAWAEADGAPVEVRQKREGKAVTVIEGGEDKTVEKAEKPKRRAPRKKKSEEEKELFPFYEQSLF
jgi:DNA-binding transcriptional MerR regulator